MLGLTSGWGDVYRWQRPGQYVEFDGGDGLYVVRTTVDKSNHVLEENETDNTSYAYIRVTGQRVELLERGQGTDPWDPGKVVFKGAGPASVDAIADEAAFGATVVEGSTATRPAAAPGAGCRLLGGGRLGGSPQAPTLTGTEAGPETFGVGALEPHDVVEALRPHQAIGADLAQRAYVGPATRMEVQLGMLATRGVCHPPGPVEQIEQREAVARAHQRFEVPIRR